jgi:L-lactate dehydrogenase (cytochrome)
MLSLHDFEAAARRRLPRPIFGYIAGAAEDNASLHDNRAVFDDYAFVTRVLRDVSQRSQGVELFGERYRSPFGIAPWASTRCPPTGATWCWPARRSARALPRS